MAPLLCAPTRRVRPSCKGFRCLLHEKRVVIGEMLLTDMPLEILSLQEREGIGQEHALALGPRSVGVSSQQSVFLRGCVLPPSM